MTRPLITTTDIELAAALMNATNKKPESIHPGEQLVEFTFPTNEITEAVTMKYATSTLCQDVRRLANSRKWLYRQCRDVARSGVGVTYG
ncbi:MAG: hypothetical protein RBQ99_07575 [Trichlorobacter sp.]|nr:hypothetical protein [Trichlorobacter sp.]